MGSNSAPTPCVAAEVWPASRFCCACDEVRQFLRVRLTLKQQVSLVQQRDLFRHLLEALKALVLVVEHTHAGGRSFEQHHVGFCVLSSDTSNERASCYPFHLVMIV